MYFEANKLFEFITSDEAYTYKYNSRKRKISKKENMKYSWFQRKKNTSIWTGRKKLNALY